MSYATRALRLTRPRSAAMRRRSTASRKDGDTSRGRRGVGTGLPHGLCSHCAGPQLAGRLAAALTSSMRSSGVEAGDGFATALRRIKARAHTMRSRLVDGVVGRTNSGSGIEGGMTTGEPLRMRAAMKADLPRAKGSGPR